MSKKRTSTTHVDELPLPDPKRHHKFKPEFEARIVFPFPKHLHKVIDIFKSLLKIKPQNKENVSEDMIICIEREEDDGWLVLQPSNVIHTNLLYHCRYPISFEDADVPKHHSKIYRLVDAKEFLTKMVNFSMSDAVVAEGCFYLVLTQWSGNFYLPEHKIVSNDHFAVQVKNNSGLPMEEIFETSSTFNYVTPPNLPANGCLVGAQDNQEENYGFVDIPIPVSGVAFTLRAGHLARMLKLAPEDTSSMRMSVSIDEHQDDEFSDFRLTMNMNQHVQRYVQRHKTTELHREYDWKNTKPHRQSRNSNYPKPINLVLTNLIRIANSFSSDVLLNIHQSQTLCIRTKQVIVDVPGSRGWQFDFMMTGAHDENEDDHLFANINDQSMQDWDSMKPKSTIDSHGRIVRLAPTWFDDLNDEGHSN